MDLQDKVGYAVRKIGRNSKQGKFTTISEVAEDLNISEEDEDYAQFKTQVLESEGIKDAGEGEENCLYSSSFMVPSYAALLKDIQDNNIAKLFADFVRKESKLYPRPTPLFVFSGPPFNYSEETIEATLASMKDSDNYSDIQRFTGGDGQEYLCSTTSMSVDYGKAIVDVQMRMDS